MVHEKPNQPALQQYIKTWVKRIGLDSAKYSTHSLRRGGCTHAFANNIAEPVIKLMGDWVSDAYKKYIDIMVEARLRTFSSLLINNLCI